MPDASAPGCPPDTEVITGAAVTKETQDSFQQGSLLQHLPAGVRPGALFVGAFIIYNTFSIIVAQRTRRWPCCGPSAPAGARCWASVLGEAARGRRGGLGRLGLVAGVGLAIG